ncbi:hypothetical protein [Chiayiivirga flava]|uniref:Sel1 repeat family protein n=1 Tax=Chiayiivirga flava TaxID=659595 RepID=A0A7W8D4L3_9GAMM|nr:hypothetical protein [Chiayiivirga flava]MBB5207836.1 hypothetical protein [Chiayiivirga flava]
MRGLGKALLLALVAGAHLAGGWWLVQQRARVPPVADVPAPLPPAPVPERPAAPDIAPDRAALPPRPDSMAASGEPPPADAPADNALPPPGTPLASMLPELEARARRGDTRAACRLALEAETCLHARDAREAAEFFETSAARDASSEDGAVAMIALLEEQAEYAEPVCAGLPDGWADANAWQYMLAAAQGDMRLATRFAVNPPLDWSIEDLQPEAWAAYREAAPALLQRAAAQGDLRAVYFLQRIHSGLPLPHLAGEAIMPDPELAVLYALALLAHTDPGTAATLQAQIDAARGAFDAAQWRDLQTRAAALAQRFAGQAPIDNEAGVLGPPDAGMCGTD